VGERGVKANMNANETTIGLLYPGEMGASVAAVLRGRGAVVVTTLRGRGGRTAERCAETGIDVLDSLADVARRANVIISLVPPAAAMDVAESYAAVAHLAPAGAIYVDANSISPESAVSISEVLAAKRSRFVDAAINGLARNLTSSGTLFLSGGRADDVARLFEGAVHVRVLGGEVGAASSMKMLLGGLSKGLCGLFLELAIVADRRGMLGEMLAATQEIYPGMQVVIDRMLPTYAEHSGRRATEMRELAATAQTSGIEPCVVDAVARLHEMLAHTNFTTASGADVRSIVRHLRSAGLLSGADITNAV
jgi:3-hydroxyisobutyrate dehydrogenase-like beta-hydroxyacid dehydrogenase